jgi:hypothetical protein
MWKRQLIFHSFYSTAWLLLLCAVLVTTVVLMVMLLRYERRLVSKTVGAALLSLRMLVIGLIFLTLLEPVLSWTIDRKESGRVLVAVDLSESMSTTDKHASKAEKLHWARALGMIGNQETNSRIDRWIKAYEQGKQPQWVDENETNDPVRCQQLAQIRKQNIEEMIEQFDRITRKEIALKLLSGSSSPLLPQLDRLGDVELSIFAGKSHSADARTLEGLISHPPESVLSELSDLSGPLSSTVTTASDSPLMGIVLLTDGRDNSESNVTAVASRLGRLSVPVFSVLLGSELRPKDLAIASLDYPQTVFKDDKPLLKATLNTSGFEGQELTVFLERDGSEPLTKTVTPENTTTDLEFELDAEEIGRHKYTIRTDPQPGETREDNNSKTFALTVVDDKVHVLLLEGEARWEFRFIDNALSRDDRVEMKRVVYRQPYLGILKDTFFPRTLKWPQDANDLGNSPFSEADLVILGDVSPNELPPEGWNLLEQYVKDSGGTLILIAGKNDFPLSFQSPVVERLLPLRNPRPVFVTQLQDDESPVTSGFHLQLTPDGEAEPMFQLADDEVKNHDIWSTLPGHYWGILGEAKPGATVYAHALQPGMKPTLENKRNSAVIVHQNYGFGQVLWIGIDSTWRWRHRLGDQYHHRFWGQLGRWAAENKTAAGNDSVRFGPQKTDIEVGEDVLIHARWLRGFLKQHPRLRAKVEIHKQNKQKTGKLIATLDMKPSQGRPLVFDARAVSLPAGEYKLTLSATGADLGDEEIATSLFVHEQETLELSDLSSNRQLLNQIAASSGGRVFLPDEIGDIPALLLPPQESTVIREELDLWNNWIVLSCFFTLLMAEWVVRKLNGLP